MDSYDHPLDKRPLDNVFRGPTIKSEGHEWGRRAAIFRIAVPKNLVVQDGLFAVSTVNKEWYVNTIALYSNGSTTGFTGINGEGLSLTNYNTADVEVVDVCCYSHEKVNVNYAITVNSDGQNVTANLVPGCKFEDGVSSCGAVPSSVTARFRSNVGESLMNAEIDHYKFQGLAKSLNKACQKVRRGGNTPSPSPEPASRGLLKASPRQYGSATHLRVASDSSIFAMTAVKTHQRGGSLEVSPRTRLDPIGTSPRGRPTGDSPAIDRRKEGLDQIYKLQDEMYELFTSFRDFYTDVENDGATLDEIRNLALFDDEPLEGYHLAWVLEAMLFWYETTDGLIQNWVKEGASGPINLKMEEHHHKIALWRKSKSG